MTLTLITGQTGQTITARLAQGTTGFVGDAIACPESPVGSGRYTGTPTGFAEGFYDVLFYSGGSLSGGVLTGGTLAGFGPYAWDGTQEVTPLQLAARTWAHTTRALSTSGVTAIQNGLATQATSDTIAADLDSIEIQLANILQDTSIDIPASISEIPAAPAAADIYTYFTASDREDQFKADLTATNTAIANLAEAVNSIPAPDLTTLETGVEAIAQSLGEIQGTGFDPATDSLPAIRDRGDAAWITANLSATNNAIANLAITLGLIASDVDSLEIITAAILQDTSIDIPGAIGALPAPDNAAIEAIQTMLTLLYEMEGFAGWVEAKAPTLAEPGYTRTENGLEFTITQNLDGSERMERIV